MKRRTLPLQLLADNLVLARGSRVIIGQLSLAVAGGEALILKGPNGSGKTTLLRALGGFLRPEAGSVRLEGGDDERDLAEQCHYVGHLNGLKPSLSVSENLEFWSAYLQPEAGPDERDLRIEAALSAFDLEALRSIPVAYLSAGQKRRASLARLVAAQRPVWFLDEPTVSLDAASVALLAREVNRHVAEGGLVVAATHLPLGLERARDLVLGRNEEAA